MKQSLLAFACIALFWCGCKENDTRLIFPTVATNSTYLGPATVATDPHNVLVEEFTGQGCNNCPAAHALLDALRGNPANQGRINVVGLYVQTLAQTVPPPGSTLDFRTTMASSIGADVYQSIPGLPMAGIDRTSFVGGMLTTKGSWPSEISSQLLLSDSLNVKATSVFSGGKANIRVTVTYTQDVYSKQKVSVFVVEDSMVDFQENSSAPGGIDSNYTFTDVFRAAMSGNVLGDPVLDTMAMKPKGQVYWRQYTYTPDPALNINPSHCHVIAFVNSPGTGGDYHVWQSVEIPLEQ